MRTPNTFPGAVVVPLLALLTTVVQVCAGNLLSNAGFESDTNSQNQTFFGWQAYGMNNFNEADPALAHGGTNYFKVFQAFNGTVNYSGIYQDYISGPGAVYSADAWAYVAATDALAGQNQAWVEVTFRDAVGNMLALFRSPLITTNALANGTFQKDHWNHLFITNQYDPQSYQMTNTSSRLVAPAGTAFVRCQIVLQGDANYSGGSAYFDDVNLVSTGNSTYGDFNITWSDEFNGTNINSNIWTYDLGGGGWGNGELEFYTSRTNNAYVANGLLHIVAVRETTNGYSYTSARLKSQGLFNCRYGRIEWRAKLPQGLGFWPALWMLGTNISSVGWPGCGEIDVMENNGSNPRMAQSSIHSGTDATAIYNFIEGGSVTNFHTYTLDWTTNALLFYVDGHLFESQTSWGNSLGQAYPYPFDRPFFLLMNLAIGGSYVGSPSAGTINSASLFPGEMQVDYVRVYNLTEPLQLTLQPNGSNYTLKWPGNIVCRLQTNALMAGLGTNWMVQATITNQFPLVPGAGSRFFRLISP